MICAAIEFGKVIPQIWGVTTILSCAQNAWSLGKGSCLKTSKHAPDNWPESKAYRKSLSTKCLPLATFIKYAPFGSWLNKDSFKIFSVSDVSGTKQIRILDWFKKINCHKIPYTK